MTGIATAGRCNMPGRLSRRGCAIMTAGTGPRRPAMIKAHHGPAAGSMAGLASGGRHHVSRRLSGRGCAVMTGRAQSAHRRMIYPGCRAPGRGRMTAGTGIGRTDMAGRLARRIRPVMTALASPGKYTVIYGSIAESINRMTILATIAARDMIHRLSRRLHISAPGVTSHAYLRRLLKHTAHMALLARQPRMRAAQREAGGEMIEFLGSGHIQREKQHSTCQDKTREQRQYRLCFHFFLP